MKLVQKLFLVVILPIIFGFLFVAIFFVFQDLALDAEKKYQNANEVQRTTDDITRDVFDMAAACSVAAISNAGPFLQRASGAAEQIPRDVDKLKTLTAQEPGLQEPVERLAAAAEDCLALARPFLGPTLSLGAFSQYHELYTVTNRLVREQESLLAINAKRLAKASDDVDRLRHYLQWLVIGGLAASLVLTVAVVLRVHRSLVKRLGHVFTTVDKIKLAAPLPERLKGEDEIAELDAVIHDLHQSLQDAQESRQQLMRMVTHDLRAPLTNVSFLMGMVAEGCYDGDDAKLKTRAANLKPELTRVNKLIEDLLDLEKLQHGGLVLKKHAVTCDEIAWASIDAVGELAAARNIAIDYKDSGLSVDADPERLVEVMVNLLSNALHHTPPGKTLTVRVCAEADAVRFEVQDEGPGVAPEHQAKLFEEFARNDPAYKGYGLGLAICKHIVSAHGGTIGVANAEGGGAIFSFQIPLEAAEPHPRLKLG